VESVGIQGNQRANQAMADVVLENVSKVYPGDVQAVKDFSLRIRNAEFIVLVGPSGCGKSTLLRMVAGLEEITEGAIIIDGRIVNDVPPKDRDVAMVFQNYALYPHMTVYKNMAFALKLRKFPRAQIDDRVRDAAGILGISELLSRKPKALSGGQRQRVAVGRAIVRQPKAFLFDEPLSNLDARLRIEMRAELKRLHHELKTTTIYVTHDQEEAMTLGDRIVVMKDGIIQQVGEPLEVYDSPTNRFVAGFVGTPPMNFLEGSVVCRNGQLYFDEGTCRIRLGDEQAGVLGRHLGREVAAGIRPEAMSFDPQGRFARQDNFLPVRISVVEPLGEKMDIHCATPRHPDIVARVNAQHGLTAGRQLNLFLDVRKVHVFEPGQAGENLSLGRAPAEA
jgi:multiple sugar transport system ATP-binding protein